MHTLLLSLPLLAACFWVEASEPTDTEPPPVDIDGDGVPNEEDCAPEDPSVYPGAPDTCRDGVDQDCDGLDGRCGWWEDTPVEAADATLQGWDKDTYGPTVWGRNLQFIDDMDGDGLPEIGLGADYAGCHVAALVTSPPKGEVDLLSGDALLFYADKDSSWDATGDSISSPGDVNGDGYADVVVGDSDYSDGDGHHGGVLLFLGPITHNLDAKTEYDGLVAFESDIGGYTPSFGAEMEAAGDMDGDDMGDLLVGASSYGEWKGAVAILSGDITGERAAGPGDFIAFLKGETEIVEGGMAGLSDEDYDTDMFSALDHNGDGVRDVWVGAPNYPNFEGRGYLLDGPVRGVIELADADLVANTPDVLDGVGQSGGDLDGDGYDDLLYAAPLDCTEGHSAGVVRVFRGPILSLEPGYAWAALYGEEENDNLGFGLSPAGDFNGDGRLDIVVGDPRKGPGAAYVVTDLSEGTHALADVSFEIAGVADAVNTMAAVTGGRDVDGDGYDDILVGSPWTGEEGNGQVFLFYGGPGR